MIIGKNDEYKKIDNMFKKDELFKKILFQEEKMLIILE